LDEIVGPSVVGWPEGSKDMVGAIVPQSNSAGGYALLLRFHVAVLSRLLQVTSEVSQVTLVVIIEVRHSWTILS